MSSSCLGLRGAYALIAACGSCSELFFQKMARLQQTLLWLLIVCKHLPRLPQALSLVLAEDVQSPTRISIWMCMCVCMRKTDRSFPCSNTRPCNPNRFHVVMAGIVLVPSLSNASLVLDPSIGIRHVRSVKSCFIIEGGTTTLMLAITS